MKYTRIIFCFILALTISLPSTSFCSTTSLENNISMYQKDVAKKNNSEKSTVNNDNEILPHKKHGLIALYFSLFIPGGGQFYNGESKKGAILLGTALVVASLFISGVLVSQDSPPDIYDTHKHGSHKSSTMAGIGAILLGGSYLYSLIDAPISASKVNRKNGYTSTIDISDNVFVGTKIQHNGYSSTLQLNAVLSF